MPSLERLTDEQLEAIAGGNKLTASQLSDEQLESLAGNKPKDKSQMSDSELREIAKQGDGLGKRMLDFAFSGPDGGPGILSTRFTNGVPSGPWLQSGPGPVESAKRVGGGVASGLTLTAWEPFKDEVGETNAYKGGQLVGTLAPWSLATKGAAAIPWVASAPRMLQPLIRGGLAGAAVSSGEEGVNVAKGGEFNAAKVGTDAAIFASLDTILSALGAGGRVISKLVRDRRYAKAARLYKEATAGVKGAPAATADDFAKYSEKQLALEYKPPKGKGDGFTVRDKRPERKTLLDVGAAGEARGAIRPGVSGKRDVRPFEKVAWEEPTALDPKKGESYLFGDVKASTPEDVWLGKQAGTAEGLRVKSTSPENTRAFLSGLGGQAAKQEAVQSMVSSVETVTAAARGLTAKSAAKEAVFTRSAEIGKHKWDTHYFIKESLEKLNKKTRMKEAEDMIFYIQKTGNPLFNKADTYEALGSRLTPEAKVEAKKISERFEWARQKINESGAAEDVAFIENYVTQLWVGKKKAGAYFRTNNPFAKKRTIESYHKGITEGGLTPRHTNVYKVLAEYENLSFRVVENNRLVNAIHSLPNESGAPLISIRKIPGMDGHVPIDSRALYRAAGARKGDFGTQVWVDPEIARPLKTVFEGRWNNKFVHAMELINAVSKKAALSFSFFHHLALSESALYSGIAPWSAKKGLAVMNNKVMRDRMLSAGLDLGEISDVQRGMVNRMLESVEASARKYAVVNKISTGVRKGNELWDKALWDYYHTGLKAHAFQTQLARVLKKNPSLAPEQMVEVERGVARHVNNAFGGQNWERLLWSPKVRQAAHLMLLAPDWTLSNLKIAATAAKTGKWGGIGNKVEGQLARRYWGRAAFWFFTMTNMANLALSGRFMWDNEDGHWMDIDTGNRDEKGRRKYIKLSKQVREPLRWMTNPMYEFSVKTAPFPNMVSEQLTGRTLSGFRTGISTRREDFFDPDNLLQRGKVLGGHALPISFSDNNFGFALPIGYGQKPKKQKSRRFKR